MIEIYGSNDRIKCQVEAGSSSQQDKALQSDNVLSLSFTHYAFLELDVNDWCEFAGERYWLQEKYLPKQKNEHEWEYDVKLYGIESLTKRLLVLQNSDVENEAVFTLTAPASEHVRLIVQSMNDGMDHTTNWKVGDVVQTENLTIDYDGTYCDEGLRLVAEAAGTEWWIEGETVNLCRCEQGSELLLRYGESLLSLDRDEADGVKFYTRLFPIGSSRNIDRSKYGSTRLQLPGGAKYVDIPDLVERYGVFHHYEQEAFSGIYPRRVGVISSVRWEEVKDTDGTPFTIWHFKDNGLPFDPNDYEIAGLVKHVSFQSGELEGRDFEVNYNSSTGEFEIITTWPYDDDMQLPDVHGGQLVPEPGNTYILWNIRMPDEYYALAEKEYQSAVDVFNREHLLDKSVYKAPINPKWAERSGAQLYVGRRVRLESQKYFPKLGYRSSRITRLTRKVSAPYQIDLEISDAVSTGTMAKIEDSIHDVKMYVRESSSVLPDIIRSWDETKPTDNNIYSARRTHKEFLSKNSADRAKKKIIFDEGIGFGSSGHAIDGDGVGKFAGITSKNFESGELGGAGFGMYLDAYGVSTAEFDNLIVRMKSVFAELEIKKKSFSAGDLGFSDAANKLLLVLPLDVNGIVLESNEGAVAYRCCWLMKDGDDAVSNNWHVDDQARCQTFNIKPGVYSNVSNRYYWRKVLEAGESFEYEGNEYNYIDLAASATGTYKGVDFTKGCQTGVNNDIPKAHDQVIQLGNQSDISRQNYTEIIVNGSDAPAIKQYQGINDYTLSGKLVRGDFYDPVKNTYRSVVYGDFYAGDKEGGGYAKYDKSTNKFVVKGKLEVGSTLEDGREVNDLGVRKGNLLRNSGFTGDYESEAVTSSTPVSEDTVIYSDPFDCWEQYGCSAVEDASSASGMAAVIGTLTQTIDGGMTVGEWYIFSFRGQSGSVTMNVGGVSHVFELSSDLERYDYPFVCQSNEPFSLVGNGAKVMELQLMAGNMPSEWHSAHKDNDRALASYYANEYLRNAILEASTTINGGLILSQIIKVGNYRNKVMTEETGGMSGAYNDERSPFLWGGGTMEQAIYTIMRYANNPTYQATDAEVLNNMAKFVVTHGGRAILNDIILRGYIYALGGVFNGTIYASEGIFSGFAGKKKTIITEQNASGYIGSLGYFGDRVLDFKKAGTWVEFRSLENGFTVDVPSLFGSVNTYSQQVIEEVRSLVGNTVLLHNMSNVDVVVTGNCKMSVGGSSNSFVLEPGDIVSMTCTFGSFGDGFEEIFWQYTRATSHEAMNSNSLE
ncbi:MAG: hypothetical protein IKH59_10655 [Bacteroidaceae bacterium]|nr:hypothetical protein [Prevotella sp.]MBR2098029.1 hypothetical protein [Prevotella sp.]MBR3022804.1 hypothetical protein [Bacteroidaceae bacterium]